MTICATEARALARTAEKLSDDVLASAWRAVAGHISFLNADDAGDDWKDAPKWRPSLNRLTDEHQRRGLTPPLSEGWLI